MIFSHDDWGLLTKECTSLNLEEFRTCVSSSAQVLLRPNLPGFLSRPTCLPPVLTGGSTVNSSSQLQPNKSWSRIHLEPCHPRYWRLRRYWRQRYQSFFWYLIHKLRDQRYKIRYCIYQKNVDIEKNVDIDVWDRYIGFQYWRASIKVWLLQYR
jgi:hypothetical protein